MFHYTAETTASVQNAIAALETSLKEEQFGVLWQFNLREKLKEKGFDFEREYVVLEVCNPAEANRVINENVLAGHFLPCKIVVYEGDGKTKIGMPKPTAFMNMLEDDALMGIAADVEARLMKCINRAANP
ncbi:hypothetical protein Theco_3808 [Thermobacillus composti KWC4]|uniref:DUF302 domain-containing protein n=1 Tax=Thermobacillus composti (strain DSM 18247 / JCM 13945 / KWC4) TaxID=717605 RepID=L0EJ35_THECK|nr:DUF302 domain-containing protein [Thermobacillus composti]AGA59822.1 hypothetical protein Theco_3808 [Thermobacillus composti KWC4]